MVLLVLLSLVVCLPVRVNAMTPSQPEFRKLAEDVYTYIGKLNDANALVVVTSEGVVLADTGVLYEQHKEWNETLEIRVEP